MNLKHLGIHRLRPNCLTQDLACHHDDDLDASFDRQVVFLLSIRKLELG